MSDKRLQLTLFVNEQDSILIEKIRKEFNPKQYSLIKSHVTLCRADELIDIETILQTLNELNHPEIVIDFGMVVRFSNGKGLLIPSIGKNKQFHELRKSVLREVSKVPRKHEAHITLMHPRNSECTNEIFDKILAVKINERLTFNKISLIEQKDENEWKVLREYNLGN